MASLCAIPSRASPASSRPGLPSSAELHATMDCNNDDAGGLLLNSAKGKGLGGSAFDFVADADDPVWLSAPTPSPPHPQCPSSPLLLGARTEPNTDHDYGGGGGGMDAMDGCLLVPASLNMNDNNHDIKPDLTFADAILDDGGCPGLPQQTSSEVFLFGSLDAMQDAMEPLLDSFDALYDAGPTTDSNNNNSGGGGTTPTSLEGGALDLGLGLDLKSPGAACSAPCSPFDTGDASALSSPPSSPGFGFNSGPDCDIDVDVDDVDVAEAFLVLPTIATSTTAAGTAGLLLGKKEAAAFFAPRPPAARSPAPSSSAPKLPAPAFEVAALTVDELRDECRRRQLDASGNKALLCERVCNDVARGASTPRRLSNPNKKRKRPHTRKEPERGDYGTDRQYQAAWKRWRQVRNNNNESVKKSRDRERAKRREKDQLCRSLEAENALLEARLVDVRGEMAFFTRAVAEPASLSDADFARLRALLGTGAIGPLS